jgi:hypothetical protein
MSMIKPLLANAEKAGDGPENSSGRWRLNAGSEMYLNVGSLNDGKTVRVVLDVGSARFAAKRIVALSEHEGRHVIGYWDNPGFVGASGSVEGDLHMVRPSSQEEAAVLAEAVRLNALIKANVPIQTSIGAEAGPDGTFELVPAGKSVEINGRKYDGGGDTPLYILRGGLITEASVVTFGADAETGRLAAKKPESPTQSTKETPMSDKLKALLGKYAEKHHGLVARCVAEGADETVIATKVHAAESDEKDKQIESLKASLTLAENTINDLKSKVKADDYNQGDKDKTAQQDATQKLQQMAASKQPEHGEKKVEPTETTVSGAIKAAIAAGAKERGFELRAKVLAANPNLQRI